MKLFLTFSFFLIFKISLSQVDYIELKNQFMRSCGLMDSTTLSKNVAFVDSVALLQIENGFEDFLLDYGQTYYSKYLHTQSRLDVIVAINAYTRCWEQFQNTSALYNIGIIYAVYDCFMSRKYLSILEENITNNKLDYEENRENYLSQIKMIREFVCPE